MYVVAHDHERPELVLAEFGPSMQRIDNHACDRFPAQVHRAVTCGVELSINPHEGLACRNLVGRWIFGLREAAVKVEGNK